MENDTFPAGILGNYYSARHQNGVYRSCSVASYYSFTPNSTSTSNITQEFIAYLKPALRKTIAKHSSLSYGILPASKSDNLPARFKRLSQISWDDIVSISSLKASSNEASLEKFVCSEIGTAHEGFFLDQETKPAWKVRVLIHETLDGNHKVYILFIVHHAIADGLSCAAFQKTLHEELSLATVANETLETSSAPWPYIVPKDVGRPIAIEDAMDIGPPGHESLEKKPQTPSDSQEEKIWTGNFPYMPTIDSYKSLALLVTIPPERAQRVLETSRRLKITVTGYLHALIVSYLARTTVTNEHLGVKGCTAYSLRKFSKLPLSEIANHVSFIVSHFPASLLSSLRNVQEGTVEEEKLIAAIGDQFSQEISTELNGIEAGGVTQIRKIEKTVDLDAYCSEGLSAERTETYEISNLGVVRMNEVPETGSLKLDGLIFSQCGMAFGAPIGCNVANLSGGPLVISLTWQSGGVEDSVMTGLQKFFQERLGA